MTALDSQNTWQKEIIEYHLEQEYGEFHEPLDVDHLMHKYHLFPNEALYIIDCKQAQLEPLSSNFHRITGIERKNKNDMSVLYDHVDESNAAALHHWVMTNLKNSFDETTGAELESDFFKCMYKTHDGRTLLKCTTGLSYDSAGAMRYTLGKLIDLTGLVSFEHFNYTYEGPNKEKHYRIYRSGLDKESILTKREKEVLELLQEGFTSRVIASRLFISVHTVDTHRRNIIDKMETKTAIQAFRKCKNLGWL